MRLISSRYAVTCLLALAGLVSAAAPATAATVIGQVDPGAPTKHCYAVSYVVQSQSASPAYAVPVGGVITSWSHRAGSDSGRELGLRIFRPLGGSNFQLVGTSGVQVLTPSVVNTFATRIPVAPGDLMGLYIGNPGPGQRGASCYYDAASGNDQRYAAGQSPEPALGAAVDLSGKYKEYALNASAVIEADADGDGYGDETQDACPTNPALQGPCPAPPAPPDDTAPVGTVATRGDSVDDGWVSVLVKSDENGTASVSGTVNVPATSKVYRLGSATAALKPNVTTRVRLRVPKRARRPIARATRRGRRIKARVSVVIRDAAGNAVTKRASIRLRR